MRDFDGRQPGSHGYLECTLATDLTNYTEGEEVPPHKQVDVCLPNRKILRLPYSWLRSEGNPFGMEDASSEVLDSMLNASELDEELKAEGLPPMPKKVVRRVPPSQ